MSQTPPEVWIAPDIALLVCPPIQNAHDTNFLDHYWRFFLKHRDKIGELQDHRFAWISSDALIVNILGQFPWTDYDRVPWVRDLMVDFERWHSQHNAHLVVPATSTQSAPDSVPAHINADTKGAWLDVLAFCVQHNSLWSHLASCPQQCTLAIQVSITTGINSAIVPLVCQSADWEGVLKQVNPWVRHNLPTKGAQYYQPSATWRWGNEFPTQITSRGLGFQDEQSRVWVWDAAEEHWDVQDKRPGRGKYIRVWPDGRLVDK